MRLSLDQVKEVEKAFKSLELPQAQIFLIGSRTKDRLRGGDLDLLVLVDDVENLELYRKSKLKLINEIKKQNSINEMGTDITIALKNEIGQDSFLSLVDKDKTLLFEVVV